ncbi:MAG: helix-turn-helix domain-containing protein [Chloroflexota bacterium]
MPKIVDDETVFQAAMQAVMSRGYDGATTRQIAESAGISEVTLFRKYGSKSELIKRAFTAQGVHFDFELAAATQAISPLTCCECWYSIKGRLKRVGNSSIPCFQRFRVTRNWLSWSKCLWGW